LLDINNSWKVIPRPKSSLFFSTKVWGKMENVNNVVFPTGAVIGKGILYTCYGAVGKLIALKPIELDNLLEEPRKEK